MSRTISTTYATGITLTNTANNPITLTSAAKVTNNSGNYGALYAEPGAANTWTIDNSGLISGGSFTGGIYLGSFSRTVANGVIINESGGTIAGDIYTIFVNGKASITNKSGGTITGLSNQAMYLNGLSTVVNSGVIIDAGNIAIYAKSGGTFTNQAGGTISGLTDGIRLNALGTVTNAGTIKARQANQYAVRFNTINIANRLIVDPGAMFVGEVKGGTGVIELAIGNGSAASLGSFSSIGITNFNTLQFDSGARWTVTGDTSAAGLGTLAITGFTAGDTIDLTGFVATSETFASNALVLTNTLNSHATLHIQGTFTSNSFSIASDGSTGTDITLLPVLHNPIYGTYATGITLPGTLGTSISVTGTITPTSGNALYGQGGGTQSWTIDNSGLISRYGCDGLGHPAGLLCQCHRKRGGDKSRWRHDHRRRPRRLDQWPWAGHKSKRRPNQRNEQYGIVQFGCLHLRVWSCRISTRRPGYQRRNSDRTQRGFRIPGRICDQ